MNVGRALPKFTSIHDWGTATLAALRPRLMAAISSYSHLVDRHVSSACWLSFQIAQLQDHEHRCHAMEKGSRELVVP